MSESNDIALHKPAIQSSLSGWSRGDTLEADAQGANAGVIHDDCAFHTALEVDPWWQVDLQDAFVIDRIVLFNRRACAERLNHFSLLKSADGETWEVIYRKTDDEVVGGPDNVPLELTWPAGDHTARFIRLRLDCENYLHLRAVQVFGHKPAPAAAAAKLPAEAPRRQSFWSFLR